MKEIWKEIKGYREIYLISNYGNFATKDREGARGYFVKGHVKTPHINNSGYLRIEMNFDGKQKSYYVHRLVAQYFVDKPEGKDFINHIDGNKLNNRADNLEWCTRQENEQHAWKTGLKKPECCSRKGDAHGGRKLCQKDVDYIRKVFKPLDKEFGALALSKKYHVRPQTITDIIHNRTWIETLPHSEFITGKQENKN